MKCRRPAGNERGLNIVRVNDDKVITICWNAYEIKMLLANLL